MEKSVSANEIQGYLVLWQMRKLLFVLHSKSAMR